MSFSCAVCDKTFSEQLNLNKHFRDLHNLQAFAQKSLGNYKCLEPNCNSSFQKSEKLIKHLYQLHDLMFAPIEEMTFTSRSEFERWKTEYELDSHCNYAIARRWKNANKEIVYYNCDPSKSVNQMRLRRLKPQSNCKQDFGCTSQLKLKNYGAKLYVRLQRTHYGHDSDLQHLRASKFVAASLVPEEIVAAPVTRMTEPLKTHAEERKERTDIVKNIADIKRNCNMSKRDLIRHKRYALSLDPWVQQCTAMSQEENPVIFYKKVDESHPRLKDSDFCLAVMNQFQQMMLKKFGSNVISIDGTNGFKNQEYHFTTVMIADESGQGYPGAFMISNTTDLSIFEVFFESMREKVGQISTNTFMSDNSDLFYTAWLQVMGPAKYYRYCLWHVNMDWVINMRLVKNITKRSSLFEALTMLQEEVSVQTFTTRLSSLISEMLADEETRDLGDYFQSNYLSNYRQWACCYEESLEIDDTNVLEVLHETVKHFYFTLKKVRRLDKCLHAVLKYVRDQSIARLLKLVKGENTIYHQEVARRHQFAINSKFAVREFRYNYWQVRTNLNKYFVTRLYDSKCCHLDCPDCDICLHVFSCTCKDFTFGLKICKHIHYMCWLVP